MFFLENISMKALYPFDRDTFRAKLLNLERDNAFLLYFFIV